MTTRSVLQAFIVVNTLALLIGWAHGDERALTIEGPETEDLVSRVEGYVVWTQRREMVALSLPAMERAVVRRMATEDAEFFPIVHALSGPDREGRIAYIDDHFFVPDENDEKHLLKTIQVDGTGDAEIFSRPGNAMWATSFNGEIGHHLSLAPSGGMVAFWSRLSNKQMPGALLFAGTIEIWDIDKKVRQDIKVEGLDEPMSWFPDGKRLAYVKLVPRDELPGGPVGLEEFGDFVKEWDELPAVHILDIESGQSTFVHLGLVSVVALDGRSMLVGAYNSASWWWKRVDIESGESIQVQWPGDEGGPIAVPADNIVVYWGLPTAGTPIEYTKSNSPLRGPKLMLTVKVALMDSDKFQTVVPYIDPRARVSFGRVAVEE
jgi:hypothetical protein